MNFSSSITWTKKRICSKCSKPTVFNSCSECSKTHYLQEKLHYQQLLERLNTLCKPLTSITPGNYAIQNGLYQVLAVKRSIPKDLTCLKCQQVPMKQEKHQYYCPSCQYSFQNHFAKIWKTNLGTVFKIGLLGTSTVLEFTNRICILQGELQDDDEF